MASKFTKDNMRKAIETCERYQTGLDLSDVKVTNLRIGKTSVTADVTLVDDDGHTKKHRNAYDLISL